MSGKIISWLALFTALSVVGASIKIPAIVGSVALDVFPALLAAVLFSSMGGAIVAAFGHLISAMLGGFPLGQMHLLIAVEMAVLVWIFAVLYKKNHKIAASALFILGNTFAAPVPFIFLMSKAFYFAILPSLLIGSIINIAIALIAIPRLSVFIKQGLGRKEVKH